MTKVVISVILALIFALIISTTIVSAQEEKVTDWLYKVDNVRYNLELKSSFESSGSPKEVKAEVSIIPRETDTQNVIQIETTPKADVQEDKIIYKWSSPSKNQEFGYTADVEVTERFPEVATKVQYPLKVNENLEFLKSTDSVDVSDKRIVELVEQLTTGEDDTLIVLHKLASWVEENIEYNLSTVTESASLSASWVLENKQGVCDELTNLFLALSRASGVPARFVSGFSYTDSPLFPEGWGLHGWAEVYIPEYGWMPVDVTYKQFGRLDLGHIILKKSDDAIGSSISYSWLGKGNEIVSKPPKTSAESKGHSGQSERLISFEAYPLRKQIGFGSYDLIVAEVENLKEYYVSETFVIGVAEGDKSSIDLEDKKTKQILLGPRQSAKIYWLIKSDSKLDKDFTYTLKIPVSTLRETKEAEVKIIENEKVHTLKEMQEFIDVDKVEEEGDVLDLNCDLDKEVAGESEDIGVRCVLKNKGDSDLSDLKICFDGECKSVDIGEGEEKEISGIVKSLFDGIQNIRVTATNEDVNEIEILPLSVEAKSKLDISLKVPEEVEYYDEIDAYFEITSRKGNVGNATLEVYINEELISTSQIEDKVRGKTLTFPANILIPGDNKVKYIVKYTNFNGDVIEENGEKNIKLVNVNLWQRFKLFIKRLIF